jgi:eukaryotic-like serine/threonine-protein kinase
MSDVVQVGQILAGKYRVERVLGQGGMGVVVAATHLQLGQQFALKFLLPHMCQHAEAVVRFAREARAAVQIQSEHVARVSDVGTLETGAPYMVMEYLQGSDLSEVLRARGPLPIPEAISFVLQACEAIAEAHALGIIHRDLKPANLFLTRRRDGSPLVKVLDFGISKALQDTLASNAPSVTSTAAIMGSPLYMSPEQVRSSKSVDARSDVWALGVILQELLTGAPTYEAETASALMAMIAADPPTPLRQRRPDAPPQLEAAVLRCLEKDRERRMPNVAELARAIAPFGPYEARASVERISRVLGEATHPHSAPAPTFEPGGAVLPGGGTSGGWGQTQARSRGNKGALFAVISLLLLGAVGIGGFLLWRAERPAPAVNEPAAPAPNAKTEPPRASQTAASQPASDAAAVAPLASVVAMPPSASATPAAATSAVVQSPVSRPKNKPAAGHRPAAQADLFDDNK